jgi:hypothetical protein
MHYAEMLFLLIAAHALCDYPLQGDFIAKHKARHIFKQIWSNGESETVLMRNPMWMHCLGAHSLIHGGAVFLITGSLILGVCEVVMHALIDFAKCEGLFGIHMDQSLHILCKLFWVFILMVGVI